MGLKSSAAPLRLRGEKVQAAAQRPLHGVFEGPVGGGDGQEEVFGALLPLRRKALVLLLRSQLRGGRRAKEGDAGRAEDATGGGLFGSCGEAEEVLKGDAAPPS